MSKPLADYTDFKEGLHRFPFSLNEFRICEIRSESLPAGRQGGNQRFLDFFRNLKKDLTNRAGKL